MTFDPDKERRNLEKHGISLSRLSEIAEPLAVLSPRDGENRWVVIGWIEGRLHAGVFTIRDGGVREISLRRANRREQEEYHRAYTAE